MIRKRLSKLSYKNLLLLTGVFIARPNLIIPTYKGTKSTVKTCNDCYGKDHHRDTRSNAFRHALWNYLLCEACFKVTGAMDKSLQWSKKITDMHEDLSPNSEIARAMDLHNNAIGRILFSENKNFKIDPIAVLQEMATKAVKICAIEDIETAQTELVYIED